MSFSSSLRRSGVRLLLLALFAAGALAGYERAPGPFVWEVSGNGLEAPSYLFGTLHLGTPETIVIAGEVAGGFEHLDTLVTEIALDAASLQAVNRAFLAPADAPPLSSVLGEELWRELEAWFEGGYPGLSLAMFERMEPWAFYMSLVALAAQEMFSAQSLDQQLYYRARAGGLKTDALETVEEQAAALSVLTVEDVRVLLRLEYLADGAREAQRDLLREMLDLYLAGDADALGDWMQTEKNRFGVPEELLDRFLRAILHERDARMAERIVERLRRDPAHRWMFAVGALHLIGAEAIPSRLESAGYTVERLPR
jgi:uncharacterized protein